MNAYIAKFLSILKSYVWFLAAFLIPLTIRSIPEILSWPYPLGLDTINMLTTIESGKVLLSGSLIFFKSQLFYHIETLAYWVTGNYVMVIKIFGPILMGLVSMMIYIYAKRGLHWTGSKSFLVSLFVGIYFVALRNSWDLYAQSFGLIFLFATLTILKLNKSIWRYVFGSVLIFLTVFSHQLVSVILLFILSFEVFKQVYKKSYRDFLFSLFAFVIAGAFFLFRIYSTSANSIIIPSNAAVEPPFTFASTLVGLFIYGYGLILPLVAVGLGRCKDWYLRIWLIWCFIALVLLIAFPSLPLYYWQRWYYLLVYPLLFLAVEGLDRLYIVWSVQRNKLMRLLPKITSIFYIVFLLSLSGFYISQSPESQITFFSANNHYLAYIPSSMLQNTISITDNPAFVNCSNWINERSNSSVTVMHYALYDLARIYMNGNVISVNHSPSVYNHLQNETSMSTELVSASAKALDSYNRTVYTVWWVSGKGWYQISSLPSNFSEVYRVDDLAVYTFTG